MGAGGVVRVRAGGPGERFFRARDPLSQHLRSSARLGPDGRIGKKSRHLPARLRCLGGWSRELIVKFAGVAVATFLTMALVGFVLHQLMIHLRDVGFTRYAAAQSTSILIFAGLLSKLLFGRHKQSGDDLRFDSSYSFSGPIFRI